MSALDDHVAVELTATRDSLDEALSWAVQQVDRLRLEHGDPEGPPVSVHIESGRYFTLLGDGCWSEEASTRWSVAVRGQYPALLPAQEPQP